MCLYVSQSNVYVIDFITFHLDMCLATAKSGMTVSQSWQPGVRPYNQCLTSPQAVGARHTKKGALPPPP